MERRLTTILVADIAGFSRLVGADEEGTLATQRAHRAELVEPLLEAHGGRIANTAGDSILVEFPSAVEAIRTALDVQAGMAERNANVSSERRIEYRIGINVGDVVAEGADLLGDGVNIAARLETLSPPGGIVLSHTVHDQIGNKLELNLADLGRVEVKNITQPVHAFQILHEGEAPITPMGRSKRRRTILAGAVLGLVAVIAAVFWEGGNPGRDDEIARQAVPEAVSVAMLPLIC